MMFKKNIICLYSLFNYYGRPHKTQRPHKPVDKT